VNQCYVEYIKAITRRYVAYLEVLLDTKFEKLRAMLHSAESWLCAMQVKINSLISARNLNRIKKYFRVFIRALGAIDLWKKWRSKISWDCLFKNSTNLIFTLRFGAEKATLFKESAAVDSISRFGCQGQDRWRDWHVRQWPAAGDSWKHFLSSSRLFNLLAQLLLTAEDRI
jgi:hypothetical protein